MKGIIFTEFLNMVEASHGMEMVDSIIKKSELASAGSYTAVGSYPHSELVSLVCRLSEEINMEVPTLLKLYGTFLFHQLVKTYPEYLQGIHSALEFLEQVETCIHVEVVKIYAGAKHPTLKCSRPHSENHLYMLYHSIRHMEDLCEGLIRGCLEHFNTTATIERRNVDIDSELFIITLTQANNHAN